MYNPTPAGWSPFNTCGSCPGPNSTDCCGNGSTFSNATACPSNGWTPNLPGAFAAWNNRFGGNTPWNTPWNNAGNIATPWNTPWNNAGNTATPWNTPWNNAGNTATPWNTPWNNAGNTATPSFQPTQNGTPFNGGWHNAPNHGHAGLNTPNTSTPSHASHGTAFGPNSTGWHGNHPTNFGGPTTTPAQGNWYPNANPFGWNDSTHQNAGNGLGIDPTGPRLGEQLNDSLPQGMKVRSVA